MNFSLKPVKKKKKKEKDRKQEEKLQGANTLCSVRQSESEL